MEKLGKHSSLWLERPESEGLSFPSLDKDVKAEVLVVGGGIAGLTTAYLLQKSGKSVVLIDADQIAYGVTGRTTAKITGLQYLHYQKMIEKFGRDSAKTYFNACQEAIDKIFDIVAEEELKCDLKRKDMFIFSTDEEGNHKINKEIEALKEIDSNPIVTEDIDLPLKINNAVGLKNQGQFHPVNYLRGLAKAFTAHGGKVYEHSRALDIDEEGETQIVKTENCSIKADNVVIASHYPFKDLRGLYITRLYPKRDYVYTFSVQSKVPEQMYIGVGSFPYSIRAFGDQVVLAGQMHKVGHGENMEKNYAKLKKIALDTFDVKEFKYYWSTQDNFTPDGVPFIGRLSPNSPHVYVATGFNAWGMVGGTLSGMILRDYINETKRPIHEIVDPTRIELKESAEKILKKNLHIGKMLLSDLLSSPKKKEIDQIPNGEAKVIEFKGKKVALSKNKSGEIQVVNAVCTHLGCTVNWNSAEKSWDCPCHGSRFDTDGEVLHGPALEPLAGVDEE
jgi:glycine/D-amino acid oxidase-like deaminating enzyme/nitrite reductase/ring-hydroxylating ferredoxin subunit